MLGLSLAVLPVPKSTYVQAAVLLLYTAVLLRGQQVKLSFMRFALPPSFALHFRLPPDLLGHAIELTIIPPLARALLRLTLLPIALCPTPTKSLHFWDPQLFFFSLCAGEFLFSDHAHRLTHQVVLLPKEDASRRSTYPHWWASHHDRVLDAALHKAPLVFFEQLFINSFVPVDVLHLFWQLFHSDLWQVVEGVILVLPSEVCQHTSNQALACVIIQLTPFTEHTCQSSHRLQHRQPPTQQR